MCLNSVGKSLADLVMVLVNGSITYSEYVFTSQSVQIKKLLCYTHDEHFTKKYILNFLNALSFTERVCQSRDMSNHIM